MKSLGKTILLQILLLFIVQSAFSQVYQPVAGDTSGYTIGDFTVSDGGAAIYNVPLILSPGTANLQPSLSLTYSSQAPNNVLGVGWAVEGFSVISRTAQTMAQDGQIKGVAFNNTDRFALDGERLVAVDPSATYGSSGSEYRTEQNNFQKILCIGSGTLPTYFTVYTKSGLIMEYGRTADAKVTLNGGVILHWLINKITDRFGNYYTYSYAQNALTGEYFPLEINYTGNSTTGLAPYASVKFDYESRTDSSQFYLNGFKFLKNTKRLKAINCFFRTTLIRSYTFNYQYNTSNFSQLISLKECGKNGSCHSPTLLNWTNATTSAFNPVPLSGIQQSATSNQLINTDLNGDGVQDLLKVVPSNNLEAYISNRSFSSLSLPATVITPPVTVSNKVVMADFNGDGKPDFLIYDSISGASSIRMNSTIASATQLTNIAVSSPIPLGILNNKKVVAAFDANGDGRSDLLTIDPANGNNYLLISTTGNMNAVTFQQNGSTSYFTNLLPASYFQNGFQPNFLDFNGDGLTDVLFYQPTTGNTALYLNSGGGNMTYQLTASNLIPPSQINVTGGVLSIPDINGDGLPDLMYYLKNVGLNSWWLNQGNNTFVSQNASAISSQIIGGTNLLQLDANGDGYTDLLWFDKVSGANRWFMNNGKLIFNQINNIIPPAELAGYEIQGIGNFTSKSALDLFLYNNSAIVKAKVLRGAAGLSNVVTQIIPGNKQAIEIAYDALTTDSLYTKGNNSLYPLMDYQAPQYVVKNWKTADGIGGKRTVSYRYSGAKLHVGGRGFRGYSQIDVIDEATGITQSKTFLNGSDSWQYISSPLVKEVKKLSSGTIISQTDIINGVKAYCSGKSFFSFVKSSTSKTYELDGTFVDSVTTAQTYDDYGNVISSVTTYAPGVQDSLITVTNNNASAWILGRMISSRLYRKNGNQPVIVKSSGFTYDSTSGTGVLIKEVSEPDSSGKVQQVKTYQRDSYGNIIQSAETAWNGTSLETHTTSTGYDPLKRFVVSMTNPQGHTSFQTYDSCLGHLLTLQNPNNLVTRQYYDNFGRLIKTVNADGTWTTLDYRKGSKDFNAPSFCSYLIYQQSSNAAPLITFYDTLNRAIRTEKKGFNGTAIYTDMRYNNKGMLATQSDPYYSNTSTVLPATQLTYDEIGRIVKKVMPYNLADSINYNGRTTTYINAKGQKKIIIKDAKEQVVLSRDNASNEIKYTYDGAGRLLQTINPMGNTIKMEYDIYGHLTKLNDPDLGLRTYSTNGFGQIVSATKGTQITTCRYDSLGRLKQRMEPEGTTKYYYDTQPSGIGLLDSIVSYNYYKEFCLYDPFGRLSMQQKRIDSQWYSQIMTYDALGRLETTKYATGFSVSNIYNTNGYWSAVKRTNTTDTLWKATSVNAKDQMEAEMYGNGLVTFKSYNTTDDFERLSIYKKNTQILYQSYGYDALHNMTYRSDPNFNVNESFQFDNLNRLTVSNLTSAGRSSMVLMAYDALGNITGKTDVGSFAYGTVNNGPHRLVKVTLQNAQTCIPSLLISTLYNSFDKVSEITKDSLRAVISYGPDHQRYTQRLYDSGRLVRTKIYAFAALEKEIKGGDTITTHYINSPAGVIGTYTTHSKPGRPAAIQYFHRDNLGSVIMATNDTGLVVGRFAFDAWGKRRNANWSALLTDTSQLAGDRGFTGHEHYDLFELVDMNGRIYDPVLGRFTSPDPFIQDPLNLQCLNRYSYCNNNPVSFMDPSGYSWRHPFRHIGHWFNSAAKAVSNVVSSAVKLVTQNLSTIATAVIGITVGTMTMGAGYGIILSGASSGFASSSAGTLFSGGNLGDALKAGLKGSIIGGITAQATYGVGEAFGHATTTSNVIEKSIAHGAIQGTASVANGGKFIHGFTTGSITSLSGMYTQDISNYTGRIAAAAIIGGTTSTLSGGSFSNGAISGAFIQMYNEEGSLLTKALGGNYCGPGPKDQSIQPTNLAQEGCKVHDHDYTSIGAMGTTGALFNLKALNFDIALATSEYKVMYQFITRDYDPWTKSPVTVGAFTTAFFVSSAFTIISGYKFIAQGVLNTVSNK